MDKGTYLKFGRVLVLAGLLLAVTLWGVRAADVMMIEPSEAARCAFLAAAARPLVRSTLTASSRLPSVSVSAFFASIMPAPVLSRSSFTIAAVTAIRYSSFIYFNRWFVFFAYSSSAFLAAAFFFAAGFFAAAGGAVLGNVLILVVGLRTAAK